MPTTTRWFAAAAAILAGVIGGFAYGKMAPALPLLKDEFHLSLLESGWLVSAFNALALTCAVVFGVLSDRIGAFRLCVFGAACLLAGGSLGAVAPSPTVLITARLLEGLGFLSIIVSAPALIMSVTTPGSRGIAFGIWAAYMPFGSAVIIACFPALSYGFGWRGVWLSVAAAAALCIVMLALQRNLYDGTRAGGRRSFAMIRTSLSHPVPWLLGIAFAMYAAQYNSIMIWLPTYLLETRDMSGRAAALATALFVITNCIGNVLGGWLVQRNISRGRIIGVTFTITTLIFFGIFAPGVPDGTRYGLILLYSAVTGAVPAAALSGGARYARTPAEVGVLQGLIVQITNVGIFFGPVALAGAVSWSGTWDSALWVVTSCATVALAAAVLIGRCERADTPVGARA